MRPILFRIPGLDIPIFSYGFMIMVGFLAGIFIATKRARKAGMDPNNILDLGIYLVIFGVLGARLFFIMQFSEKFGFQILNIFDGNLSVTGILIGAALGGALYFLRKKFSFLKRFHKNSINNKAFFILISLLCAIVIGRGMYVALTPSSTKIVAIKRDISEFYADSLEKEVFVDPQTQLPDKRITVVTGRLRVGDELGRPGTYAYEFTPTYEENSSSGYTFKGAKNWLLKYGIMYKELRPAYDLMLFEIWKGGLVYYGGVIGALLAAIFFAYRRKIKFWQMADICTPSLAVGLAAGRIGCFLNGCCWGGVAENFPLAMTFPAESPAFYDHLSQHLIHKTAQCSLPVYPTQLASMLLALLLAVIVWQFGRSRLKRNHGDEFLLLGILYPWARFAVEIFRGDHKVKYIFESMTISQIVGLFVFIVVLAVFVVRRWKGWGRIEPVDIPAGKAPDGAK